MSALEAEIGDDGVATVWFNNPGHLNALSNEMVIGLCREFPRLGADGACTAIVLRGRGAVFCAGRELSDLKKLQSADPTAVAEMYGYMQKMNEVIYFCPKPVIGIIERYALGIGVMLATWTDIALTEEGTVFGYPEVHHGITPYGAVPTMLNTMNQKGMLDLLMTGRRIDAYEAQRLGIVSRVVAKGALEQELARTLEDLGRGSAAAVMKSKQFVRECETLTYRQGIEAATEKAIVGLGMPETKAGVSRFFDRK